MEINGYKLLYAPIFAGVPNALEGLVNKWIAKGWEPVGGPYINDKLIYQAMVIKEAR